MVRLGETQQISGVPKGFRMDGLSEITDVYLWHTRLRAEDGKVQPERRHVASKIDPVSAPEFDPPHPEPLLRLGLRQK